MKTLGTAVGIVAMGALIFSCPAEAAKRFGVACLTNKTTANIKYRFKVGDGSWQVRFMGPGQGRSFSHKYEKLDEDKSPSLLVEYDSDARANKNFTTTKTLLRKAAVGDSCGEDRQYVFRYEGANRNFILLDDAN